jgi:superfamily II DNA/RNA helicase
MDVFGKRGLTQAIIFVNTEEGCKDVLDNLRRFNYTSKIMHALLTEEERDSVV